MEGAFSRDSVIVQTHTHTVTVTTMDVLLGSSFLPYGYCGMAERTSIDPLISQRSNLEGQDQPQSVGGFRLSHCVKSDMLSVQTHTDICVYVQYLFIYFHALC